MKRLKCLPVVIILLLIILLAIIPGPSFAAEYSNDVNIGGNTASGDFTGSYLVTSGPGTLKKIIINTDGTYNVTVVLRDSLTAGAGKVVWRGTCLGVNRTCVDNVNSNYDTGLYGNVTTSATSGIYYNVEYRSR